jgi:hypothetical protein
MGLGSRTKKLKSFAYKSEMEFVTGLNLIWHDCCNQDMNHPLRHEAEELISPTIHSTLSLPLLSTPAASYSVL